MLSVILVSFARARGGAARAALSCVNSLRDFDDLIIEYVVAENDECSSGVSSPGRPAFAWHFLKRCLALFILKFQISDNKVKRSLNLFSSNFVVSKLKQDADIIHLHWINNETISLSELGKILNEGRPCVITLHDEWLYTGSEHYAAINSLRYADGYNKKNKDVVGVDIDRFIFHRKMRLRRALNRDNVLLTAPSKFLADKAMSSKVLGDKYVKVVPNIIDTAIFCPKDKTRDTAFIKNLGLHPEEKVLLVGAVGGGSPLKGFDLLQESLHILQEQFSLDDICVVSFGGPCSMNIPSGIRLLEIGYVGDSCDLAALYSRADLTLVPSRIEAFGQIAAESLACATPVVAFDNSGLSDVVKHGLTGFLAPAFDTKKYARAIYDYYNLSTLQKDSLRSSARNDVVSRFSPRVVSKIWRRTYDSLL